jgi:DNA-binding NarL/FixJ family response regulator
MRILVIDDHTLFREALSLVLKQIEPDTVIISAANCEQALGALN